MTIAVQLDRTSTSNACNQYYQTYLAILSLDHGHLFENVNLSWLT